MGIDGMKNELVNLACAVAKAPSFTEEEVVPLNCVLCGCAGESIDYLFYECVFSGQLLSDA